MGWFKFHGESLSGPREREIREMGEARRYADLKQCFATAAALDRRIDDKRLFRERAVRALSQAERRHYEGLMERVHQFVRRSAHWERRYERCFTSGRYHAAARVLLIVEMLSRRIGAWRFVQFPRP